MSKEAFRANRQFPLLKLKRVESEEGKKFLDPDSGAMLVYIPGYWEAHFKSGKKNVKLTGPSRKELLQQVRSDGGFRLRRLELQAALKAGSVKEEDLIKAAKKLNPDYEPSAPKSKATPKPKGGTTKKKPAAKKKASPKRKKLDDDVDPLS